MILGWYRHRDLTDFGSGRYIRAEVADCDVVDR